MLLNWIGMSPGGQTRAHIGKVLVGGTPEVAQMEGSRCSPFPSAYPWCRRQRLLGDPMWEKEASGLQQLPSSCPQAGAHLPHCWSSWPCHWHVALLLRGGVSWGMLQGRAGRSGGCPIWRQAAGDSLVMPPELGLSFGTTAGQAWRRRAVLHINIVIGSEQREMCQVKTGARQMKEAKQTK